MPIKIRIPEQASSTKSVWLPRSMTLPSAIAGCPNITNAIVLNFVATDCNGTLSQRSAEYGMGTMNHRKAIAGALQRNVFTPHSNQTAPAIVKGNVQPSKGMR